MKIEKKKKRSWIRATCIVLVGVLLVGSLAALFPRTTSDSLNQNSILGGAPNEVVVSDKLSRAEMLAAISSKEHVVPANGTETNYITFSEVVSSNTEEVLKSSAFSRVGSAVNYGVLSTLGHYLEFTTPSDDENAGLDNTFSFRLNKNGDPIDLMNKAYVTVDFDIWTNSEYVKNLAFVFRDSTGSEKDGPRLNIKINQNDCVEICSDNTYKIDVNYPEKPMHITFVCKLNMDYESGDNGMEYYYSSETLVYVDGKYFCSTNNFLNYKDLKNFQIYFKKNENYSNQGSSVCVDNFQVNTFGTWRKPYIGALDDLYESTSNTLFDCEDSVLYNK